MICQRSVFGGRQSAENRMKKKKLMVDHQRIRKLIDVKAILEPFVKQVTAES